MFWTNLGESDQEIIDLYHAHGECEQFHSEIKAIPHKDSAADAPSIFSSECAKRAQLT